MNLTTTWAQKYRFEASDGTSTAVMDTKPPFGDGAALSPKQLCLAAIEGCAAMDVISHLNKHKQVPKSFRIEAQAKLTETQPKVFTEVRLDFYVDGETQTATAVEAARLSMTKYCGVTAMMVKNCPVYYRVFVNGTLAAEDEAKF